MTRNNARKSAARELAAAEGISYTAALRKVLGSDTDAGVAADAVALLESVLRSSMTGPDALVDSGIHPRTYTATRFQPGTLDNGSLPKPFYVLPGGHIWRQDFWNGTPQHVVGFQRDPEVLSNDVPFTEWEREVAAGADPGYVAGFCIITRDGFDGSFNTWHKGLSQILVSQEVKTKVVVSARFTPKPEQIVADTGDAPDPFVLDVSPYLSCLSRDEILVLRGSGWDSNIAAKMLYEARGLTDPREPGLAEAIERACDWAEDRADLMEDVGGPGDLDDFEGESARPVYIEAFDLPINPIQAEAWVDQYKPDLRLPRVQARFVDGADEFSYDVTGLLNLLAVTDEDFVVRLKEGEWSVAGEVDRLLELVEADGSKEAERMRDRTTRYRVVLDADSAQSWADASGLSRRLVRKQALEALHG